MNTSTIVREINKINRFLSKNSPAILVTLGITGFATTVVMGINATPKAMKKLNNLYEELDEREEEMTEKELLIEEVKVVAPVYLPTLCMGVASAGCIIGSYSINTKRLAGLATAYSISERTLREYHRKVVDTIGEKKEERIRDEISKERIENDPLENHEIIMTGHGDTLCYDSVSGRYFASNADKLRKAETDLNRRLISEMYISLNDFFDEIDIPHIRLGDELGWNIDDPIEIRFSSQLSENDTPCLVIEYGVVPRYDYRNLH